MHQKIWKDTNKIVFKCRYLDTRAVAAHGVHVTDEDMDILASKNVTVVHNPVSNGKLGSGICRVLELMQKG